MAFGRYAKPAESRFRPFLYCERGRRDHRFRSRFAWTPLTCFLLERLRTHTWSVARSGSDVLESVTALDGVFKYAVLTFAVALSIGCLRLWSQIASQSHPATLAEH